MPFTPTPNGKAAGPGGRPAPARPGWTPQRMTRWFDPVQLLRTGVRALLSGVFGAYADQREMQAALAHGVAPQAHDHSAGPEFWLDYAADLGDGFDATYTTAWLLARGELALPAPAGGAGAAIALPRGQVLVLGGDQVYPTASRSQYENRFSGPYGAALPWLDEERRPVLYAVPGNHDWYDGLTSFMRLFCQRRSVGAWMTRQQRSYFALKLPHRWWLLGIDIQLAADIDQPQLEYFTRVAEGFQPGDHVILCTAQPSWVEQEDGGAAYRNLLYFERRIITARGARLMLALSGDLHHYARYADATGTRHKVTAGGGGAYLYGTHRLPDELHLARADAAEPADPAAPGQPGTDTYARRAEYPDARTSARMRLGAWRLGVRNPGFILALGLIHALGGWWLLGAGAGFLPAGGPSSPTPTLLGWLAARPPGEMGAVLFQLAGVLFRTPALMALALLFLAGLYAFCTPDPGRPRWLRAVGVLHGAAQLALMLALTFALAHLVAALGLDAPGGMRGVARDGVYLAGMLVLGGGLGALLFALALLPGVNFNEAFSAQRIEDYRNFLRIHLAADGTLTVYPVGIDRVKRWERDRSAGPRDAAFRPRDGKPPEARLIEPPFTIPGPGASRRGPADPPTG